MDVKREIDSARDFGERLENLVVERKTFTPTGDRDVLLIGYWALLFDHHKGILRLLLSELFGSAFALVRPIIEALIRAHVAVIGTLDDVARIRKDEYRVDFTRVGSQIDSAFGLDKFFQNFLERARKALHSYTHAGVLQLGRRFDGTDVAPRYSDEEIVEVIRTATTAAFMMTFLITSRFGFKEEKQEAEKMFLEWGKQPAQNPQRDGSLEENRP